MDSLDSKYLILGAVVLVGALAYFFLFKDKSVKEKPQESRPVNSGSVGLQLQAYERLALLVDRIALHNLISRTAHEGLTAREMQLVLTRNIRDEFDYNITQQIYITP